MENEVKNGYFQIIYIADDAKLRIFGPDEGGELARIAEVTAYLDRNSFRGYDAVEINAAINKGDKQIDIDLPKPKEGQYYPISEAMMVRVSEDKMEAIVRFYPPSNNGEKLGKEDIIKELNNQKVVSGIDDQVIKNHILSPRYCTDILIAKGTPYVEGRDASIEYTFETELKARPKRNEDGSVDFHKLDIMNPVHEGDLLATLTREDPGEPGLDVYGNMTRPPKVVRKILRFGKNIRLSEDETQIFSMVDGHVTLEDERVYVYNVYEVAADVDATTGDIQYDGNITVKGNIRTGFKVTASGNIEVYGVVEGAAVKAGGDVILRRGIQGMGKGIIVAKGNIVSKFIESATVVSEGFIETEAVMHSRMSAKGDIKIQGSKGNLIGGFTRSTCLIEAKVIGAPMGTITNVEVGIDPAVQDKINKIRTDIAEKSKELGRLKDVFEVFKAKKQKGKIDFSTLASMTKTAQEIQELNSKIIELQDEHEKLKLEFHVNESARIVGKTVYPGVKMMISGEPFYVNNEIYMTQFKKVNGEIQQTIV